MKKAARGAYPVLYSFRRCPYAMRARIAIHYSGLQVELREVLLRDLPAELVEVSPKQTVPVLVFPDGKVLEESWDIILWALKKGDPEGWLGEGECNVIAAGPLIEQNDYAFKADLDRYKYAGRDSEHTAVYYRRRAERFPAVLESRLVTMPWLLGDAISVADISIFPFIRQFAIVDMVWFGQSPYVALRTWLARLQASQLFLSVMEKYPVWTAGCDPVYLGEKR